MVKKGNTVSMLPDEVIINKIYFIRGENVMLDRDLAEMYDVQTKVLKQAVKRNIDIFPEYFMFEMSEDEFKDWRSQFVTSNSDKMGLRYKPYCFTEHGVLQLSNVIKSERARQMSIRIIEIFVRMRTLLLTHMDILLKLEQIEKQLTRHNKEIQYIFQALKELIQQPNEPRKRIGFKP